jgi:hypothetical protein
MKARVCGVEIILDENNDSDGHHRFELLLGDVYANIIINDNEMKKAFDFLLDKYKDGEEFEFNDLGFALSMVGEEK